MEESVACRYCPIRPVGGPTHPQKLFPPHQPLTLFLNHLHLSLQPCGHHGGGELRAGHAGHL